MNLHYHCLKKNYYASEKYLHPLPLDLNNLNILLIYGLIKTGIEKELEIMSIDTNALVKDFDELLFKNLALALNGLSIFKEDKKTKELNNNLPKYWDKSFKNKSNNSKDKDDSS